MHWPALVSHVSRPHETHAAPLVPCPHCVADCESRGMHWPLIESQQPEQVDAEHVGGGEAVHRWLVQNGVVPEHDEHDPPLEPHAVALVPGRQAPVPRSMQPAQLRHAPL